MMETVSPSIENSLSSRLPDAPFAAWLVVCITFSGLALAIASASVWAVTSMQFFAQFDVTPALVWLLFIGGWLVAISTLKEAILVVLVRLKVPSEYQAFVLLAAADYPAIKDYLGKWYPSGGNVSWRDFRRIALYLKHIQIEPNVATAES